MTKQRYNKTRKDVCQEITNNLIASLEKGVLPWRMDWDASGAAGIPSNAVTGNNYNGMNVLNLWVSAAENGFGSSKWLTYKQAQEAGGQVRKGEKSTVAIFYKTIEVDSREQVDENGNPVKENIPMLKSFRLFNLDQIDGLEHLKEGVNRPRYEFSPIQAGEQLLAAAREHLTVHESGAQAFYRPSTDEITMPERDRFPEEEKFYAVFAHEFTHATKHKTRCDRKPYSENHKTAYAFEELVAEIGSLFAAAHIGMPQPVANHDSYIASWLEALKNDKRLIFKAAAQAQQAADWMLDALDKHLKNTAA